MQSRRLTVLIFCAALLEFDSHATAADEARLLPGSATSRIGLTWSQDGQVVEYTLTNPPGAWVITEITLNVEFAPSADSALATAASAPKPRIKQPTPHRRQGASLELTLDELRSQGIWAPPVQEPMETHKITLKLLPGQATSSHLELRSTAILASVRIAQARGREPTGLEKLRNMIR
jgi:hypothetical protein